MRRKRNKTKKRMMWLAINLILLAFIAGMGWFAYGQYMKQVVANFIEEKTETVTPTLAHEKESGRLGASHVTAFFPLDKEGKRISVAEAAIQELIDKEAKASSGEVIEEVVFIATKESASHFDTVRQLQFTSETYPVQLLKLGAAKKGEERLLLLKENNEVFGLGDLIKDQAAYEQIVNQALEAGLTQKGLAGDQVTAAMDTFKNLPLSEFAFDYKDSQLILDLPQEVGGISQLVLPIASVFPAIQGDYLNAADKTAYEAYQEEERIRRNQKAIALTFDDGPSATTTPMILDTLKRYNAKATFFILGQNIPGNEAILKRIVEEGHEVANHTWSHPDLTTLSAEQIREEITKTQDAIREVTGKTPTIMRPPYGSVNQMVMDTMNLPVIYWSVDTLDWQNRDPHMILANVQAATQAGGIILMHDIHQATADSLPAVLDYLQSQGYHFATSSELLGTSLNPQHIYYNRDASGPAQ